jgi:hypothetical protein
VDALTLTIVDVRIFHTELLASSPKLVDVLNLPIVNVDWNVGIQMELSCNLYFTCDDPTIS